MDASQGLRVYAGRWGLSLSSGQAWWVPFPGPEEAKAGWWGRGLQWLSPPFACHSAMISSFYGVLGFSHKPSWLWSSLLPSLQAIFQQPTGVPFLGPYSKCHLPAPSPPPQQEAQDSGWGSTELWHRPHARFLLCPALHRPSTVFPFDPLKVSSCASRHPHYKVF